MTVTHQLCWRIFGFKPTGHSRFVPKLQTKNWRNNSTATLQDTARQKARHSPWYQNRAHASCKLAFQWAMSRSPNCVPNEQQQLRKMASKSKSHPTEFWRVSSHRDRHPCPVTFEWILVLRLRWICSRTVNYFQRTSIKWTINLQHIRKCRKYWANPWPRQLRFQMIPLSRRCRIEHPNNSRLPIELVHWQEPIWIAKCALKETQHLGTDLQEHVMRKPAVSKGE